MRSQELASDWLKAVAARFSTHWGEPRPTSDPMRVDFARAPVALPALAAGLRRKTSLLSGRFRLELTAFWSGSVAPTTVFKGARQWTGDAGNVLISRLNADAALTAGLEAIHLESLAFSTEGGGLTLRLVPYGGGIAFTMLPPVRFRVPIPGEQIPRIARVLEMLGRHVVASQIPASAH